MACGVKEVGPIAGEDEESIETMAGEEPVEGGEIVLPLTTFNTLNPLKTQDKSYYHFSKLIYEGLFEISNDFNIKGQLAESYRISDDGRNIEVKLREDVLWHDGERFKSDDVAFTINTIKYAREDSAYGEMFKEALGGFGPIDINRVIDVTIIDDWNLLIKFDKAYANSLEVLSFPIIPKHVFIEGRDNNSSFVRALSLDDYKVIGTGPFKFKSYEKKKEVTLEANESYREGRPYINEVIGRVIGTEDDILTAFETGQINMATTVGVDWDKYDQNKRINILEFISPNCEFLGFNFAKEKFYGERGQSLRRAIAYGIDRQSIIETVYLGHGTQTDIPIHPNSWLVSDHGNSFGYNLEEAKKELKKIGWEEKNSEGLLENENGDIISLSILTNTYNPIRLKTAEMIKEDLFKIGIQVNIRLDDKRDKLSREDIESQWLNIKEGSSKFDYDMILLGWQLSAIPDLSFALHSSKIASGTNLIKYSNGEMDKALEEAFLIENRDEKIKNYEALQRIIVRDLPYMSLFFKNQALLVDSKIIGELNPVFFNPYKGIEKSYIPKELQ